MNHRYYEKRMAYSRMFPQQADTGMFHIRILAGSCYCFNIFLFVFDAHIDILDILSV